MLPDFSDPEALIDWCAAHPGEAQVMVERAHQLRLEVARKDVNEFIELVGVDEESGAPLVQAPIHEAFQKLCDTHKRLIIWSHVESGKTVQVAILRLVWLLGRNPKLRLAVVSRTQTQASKVVSAVKAYIEKSEAVRAVFPDLLPGAKWTDGALKVKGAGHAKDYSLQALGVGTAVLGARLDGVVMDDVLDWENTRTPTQRQGLLDWYKKTIGGRLTRAAFVVFIGNAWHPEDILHTLARNPVWAAFRFPVVDPETGAPRWPERWPQERIDAFREEHGPAEAARQLFCQARDDAEARFKREWIDKCLARGEGRELPLLLHTLPPGYRTYTGVDLGTRETKTSDLTVLFTICVHPNEDREVLCVESGRWTGPDIVARVLDAHKRFMSIVLVENNAAQDFIRQFIVAGSAVPVLPFTTGKNKAHPEFGVESLAVELHNAKWIIPNHGGRSSVDVEAWIAEMLYYSPDAHTGDRLMASWFAREGSRKKAKVIRTGRVDLHKR